MAEEPLSLWERASERELLLAAAKLAREQAYAPYSHLFVGAAVMSASGKMYAGCNVENASYGLSVCAERTAIFAAVAAGERRIRGLAVVSSADAPSMPCGACRQVLQEFAGGDVPIALAGARGAMVETTLADLFPRPFTLP